MNYVFLMDALENVVVEKDTSLALMVGAHRKGHKVYFLPDGGIMRKNNKLQFHVREVVHPGRLVGPDRARRGGQQG